MNKLERALADLNAAVKLAPDDGLTYEAKAEVLGRLKRYDEAHAALDKARKLSPDSLVPLVEKARIHTQQQKLDAAVEDLNRALAIDPGDLRVLMMRAELYQDLGDKGRALADVERILKLKPRSALAIRRTPCCWPKAGAANEAIGELEQLRQVDPKDALTLLQLAILYTTQKKSAKAIETYTAVLCSIPPSGVRCGDAERPMRILASRRKRRPIMKRRRGNWKNCSRPSRRIRPPGCNWPSCMAWRRNRPRRSRRTRRCWPSIPRIGTPCAAAPTRA